MTMAKAICTYTTFIIVALFSTVVNGICPARENGSALVVVVPYQRISSKGPNDTTIDRIIGNFLDRSLNFGSSSSNPASSCRQIADLRPSYESGYYWIQGVSGAVEVYCEMGTNNRFGQSGGWMRIADVDMRNNNTQCPSGLVLEETGGKRFCREVDLAPGCSRTIFSTEAIEYTKVCGRLIGYQFSDTYGFGPSRFTPGIHETYVDGISVTHGTPRQHVWTFASANFEENTLNVNCPCLHPSLPFTGVIPTFVGNDYFCDTGSKTVVQGRYYFEDPLWNGEGCEGENECCDRGPWFCKQLPKSTRDDIEMRLCNNNGFEDAVLEQIELYIQ